MKKVKLDLCGIDGNAFAILGKFARQAKRQGWSQDEIQAVFDEAQSGDYDHLLQTIMKYTEDEDE